MSVASGVKRPTKGKHENLLPTVPSDSCLSADDPLKALQDALEDEQLAYTRVRKDFLLL